MADTGGVPVIEVSNFHVSDFCHLVAGAGDLVAVYNALTLGVVVVDKATASLLADPHRRIVSSAEIAATADGRSSELIEALVAHKLIFPVGQRPDLDDYIAIQHGLSTRRIGVLYLLLTDVCNLSCSYCFVEGSLSRMRKPSLMSADVAKRGLELFSRAVAANEGGVDKPQVIFYGGEPLTNLPVLEVAVEYLHELKQEGRLPPETTVTINTNGTLINDAVISLLRRVANLQLAISIDGPAEVQDRLRPFRHGGGTFEHVMRGYRLLQAAGIEAGFCCTITRQNVENLDGIARWFVEDLGVKSLGFNILIESSSVEATRGAAVEYAGRAAAKIIECFRYFRERGVYEDRVMRKVNAFVDGHVYYRDCGACGEQLVVAPDGAVGVCQGYGGSRKHFVQPTKDFEPHRHAIWEHWRFRSPLFLRQCRDCVALAVCGGGCPYSADLRNGSIWELDDVFCEHARATVTFLLKDLIENRVNGVKEPLPAPAASEEC